VLIEITKLGHKGALPVSHVNYFKISGPPNIFGTAEDTNLIFCMRIDRKRYLAKKERGRGHVKSKNKADHLYSALHSIQTTLKRSGIDHTVLPVTTPTYQTYLSNFGTTLINLSLERLKIQISNFACGLTVKDTIPTN